MPDELEVEGVDLEETAEEPELIFGKYKTIEDAEKGYKELERDFHAARQPAKEATEDFGYIQPPQGTAPTLAEPPDPNEAFYENPAQFVQQTLGQTLQQVRQMDRIALANRKAALRELKNHSMYETVRDDLEGALDMIDSAYLVDPNQAKLVIRAMFGERLVEQTAHPLVKPAGTARRSPAPEIEQPASSSERDNEAETLDADGDALLRSLGLPLKARQAATDSFTRRTREERTRR